MAYCVRVKYNDNSRPLDDNASGDYEREFNTKRAALDYVQAVGRHAEAKPWIEADVTVIELVHYQHVYRNIWNAR